MLDMTKLTQERITKVDALLEHKQALEAITRLQKNKDFKLFMARFEETFKEGVKCMIEPNPAVRDQGKDVIIAKAVVDRLMDSFEEDFKDSNDLLTQHDDYVMAMQSMESED